MTRTAASFASANPSLNYRLVVVGSGFCGATIAKVANEPTLQQSAGENTNAVENFEDDYVQTTFVQTYFCN